MLYPCLTDFAVSNELVHEESHVQHQVMMPQMLTAQDRNFLLFCALVNLSVRSVKSSEFLVTVVWFKVM